MSEVAGELLGLGPDVREAVGERALHLAQYVSVPAKDSASARSGSHGVELAQRTVPSPSPSRAGTRPCAPRARRSLLHPLRNRRGVRGGGLDAHADRDGLCRGGKGERRQEGGHGQKRRAHRGDTLARNAAACQPEPSARARRARASAKRPSRHAAGCAFGHDRERRPGLDHRASPMWRRTGPAENRNDRVAPLAPRVAALAASLALAATVSGAQTASAPLSPATGDVVPGLRDARHRRQARPRSTSLKGSQTVLLFFPAGAPTATG